MSLTRPEESTIVTYGTAQPPAGWYPDPQDATATRWWDGAAWTASTRPGLSPAPAVPPMIVPTAQAAPPAPPPTFGAAPAPYAGAVVPSPYQAGSAQPYLSQPAAYAPTPIGAWRSPVDNRPVVVGMGSAVRTVLSKYARFDGRASRSEYWYWVLFNAILGAGILFLFAFGAIVPPVAFLGVALYLALIVWFIGVYIAHLAVVVRRLRDAGFHWALIFLVLVPFGGLAVLVMCCQRSKYP